MKDPDSLNLTKEQILERLEKIQKNILSSKEGKIKEVKFKLVLGFVKWLVTHYDIDVLNNIFLNIVKEFDDMRYENMLNDPDSGLSNLNILKKVKEGEKENVKK